MSVPDQVVRRRLATQRISSAPLPTATDAARLLTCVQAQDPPMALWALGLRSRTESEEGVRAEQAAGRLVRTHVLRPTWHFVAAEDLRWILQVTSPKVESGLAARHRRLGLDDHVVGRGLDVLAGLLAGHPRTRRQLGELDHPDLPPMGPELGHLLMLGELRGLICSGPPDGTEHTYALVDDVVPAQPHDRLDREEGVRRLVHRFFVGHGPATDRDLGRWCSLNLTEIRAALADLEEAGMVAGTDVDGDRLWFDPARPPRATRSPEAVLLSVFDEVFLTYPRHGFPRTTSQERADRSRIWAQAGGGIVVVGRRDVGTFRRTVPGGRLDIEVLLEDRVAAAEREAITVAAARMAGFAGRDHQVRVRQLT